MRVWPVEHSASVAGLNGVGASVATWLRGHSVRRSASTRPSRTRPGQSTWVHNELGLVLRDAPKVSNDAAGWHVSLALVKAIIQSFFLAEQRPMQVDDLFANFEACVPLYEGTVSKSKSLRTALRAARQHCRPSPRRRRHRRTRRQSADD